MAEVADEYAGTSYIMPQKKNVTVLQRYIVLVNNTITAFTRLTFQAARCSFGIAANLAVTMMGSFPEASAAIDDSIGAVRVLRGLVASMSFNERIMREKAGIHFTQGTELADTLFREKGIAFRTAHRIVGALVREAVAHGTTAAEVTAEMLNVAAVEVTGKPIDPPYDVLWKVLDPMGVVEAHSGFGAVAPQAVKEALGNRSRTLHGDAEHLRRERQRLSEAQQKLKRAVDQVLRSASS